MNTKPGVLWMALFWLLLVLSVSPMVAYGQHLSPEQLKAMPPKALIQAWESATRTDRSLIQEALLENRSSSLLALHEAVLTGTFEQKRLALDLLAEMRDKRSIETLLLAATSDSDDLVRTRTIIVLRDIGDRSVAPRLRNLLRASQSGFVLSACLAALGKLGSSQDIPLIKPWLTSPEEGVRVQTAAALALLGSSEGQDILLASTRSNDPLMQQWATEALGYLNTAEARARLEEILNDPIGQWKSYARIALAQQELNTKDMQAKIESLNLLTQDTNNRVARWAVEQLADLGTPEATQLLRDIAPKGGKVGQRATWLLKAKEGR